MEYTRIADLNDDKFEELRFPELRALGNLWIDKKGEIEKSAEYKQFLKKMQREWAIETGIIGRRYTWDRGVTEILIEHGIGASIIEHKGGIHNRDKAENIASMIKAQEHVINSLFEIVKQERPLSEHFIRGLHAELTAHQDYTEGETPDGKLVNTELLKGKYKEQPNNPKRPEGVVHEYCPPEFVQDEMQYLIARCESEIKKAPEVLSAWLHHRFTHIHPFQDGNGRVARTIASLVFLRVGLFPLTIRESDREDYINALEEADKGDIAPLVKLFAKRQRDSILSALGIQKQVEQSRHSKKIVEITVKSLKEKFRAHREEILAVYDVAKELQKRSFEKLSELQEIIKDEFRGISDKDSYDASARQAKDGEQDSYYFHQQIVELANEHDYFVNVYRYKSWSRLSIYTDKTFEIVFSIHGHGHEDNGVMVVSGFTLERIKTEEPDGRLEPTNTKSTGKDIFQFNYRESKESICQRFDEWLEDSVVVALAEWQKAIL